MKWQYGSYKNNSKGSSEIVLLNLALQNKLLDFKKSSVLKITLGDYYRIEDNVADLKAHKLYTEVLKSAKKEQDSVIVCEALKRILQYHSDNGNLYNYQDHIKLHHNYSYDEIEKNINTYFLLHYKISTIYQKASKEKRKIDNLQLADSIKIKRKKSIDSIRSQNLLKIPDSIFKNAIEKANNSFLKAQFVQLNGIKYYYSGKKQKAYSLYDTALTTYQSIPNNAYARGKCFGLLMNKGSIYLKSKDFKKAKNTLLAAQKLIHFSNSLHQKVSLQRWLRDIYDRLGIIDSAYYFSEKRYDLQERLIHKKQIEKVYEIQEKYKNVELRADNLEQEAKTQKIEAEKAQSNTYLTIALALLTLVIISAYLLQKNTRKKQLLAEQAKDLEVQKVANLLKEQELSSIDAMIAGQEKERQRIAEDLHDDLGGLMATINLHLENVGSENNPNALNKTKTLLGEAYEKIRSISHVKNAGVMASKGLLVAVNDMAAKVTASNRIHIEVIDYGLNERLENSLELSLFRMIQELITNIIKHAEASNATIQLTQHSQNLNIIVEDNGKGFDFKNLKETGIGLENIKKRVTHLNGKLTIDSTLGKGTTILVDIPLS